MSTIAFCGLGMMGWEMATRLRQAGHDVRAWNRSQEKTARWIAAGGTGCDTPMSAAQGAASAHLMLADDNAVESTLFGTTGLLAGLTPGSIVVDHSTVSVSGAQNRAARAESLGHGYLQAPVFVSPAQLARGEGIMLVGGDPNSYAPLKAQLTQIVGHHLIVGNKAQEAAAFKLMGNCMLMFVVEGMAEFFAIAKASGIDPQRAYSLFNSFNPCGTIARRGPRIANGDYMPAAFELSMGRKDVGLMIEAVHEPNLVPALDAIEKKMQRLCEQGYARYDLAGLGIDAVAPRGGEDR